MNSRITVILVVALLISGGATFLVYRVVLAHARGTSADTTQVVLAARNIDVGMLIKSEDLTMGTWTGALPKGVQAKQDTLIGRGVVAQIYAGEPVMETRLAAPGAGGGLAATIPQGMRAVAVRVDDIVGVAGFVVPGMRVDVLISGVPPGQVTGGAEVKTLLQNIQVLSAGQNYQKDTEGKPTVVQVVNLLVTPEQAESLSLASNQTRIQLVLRNRLDTENVKTPGTAVAALFDRAGRTPAPAVVAAPRNPRVGPAPRIAPGPPKVAPVPLVIQSPLVIEVINGAQRTEAKFVRPGDVKPEEKQ